uniref:CS domain-containing protein n=1 Tax=Vannella robusta TaxID=1487602 RepID=A0A7S4IA85_9EUKA|mmetsp:Transcript_22560/g.28809  ORF Transcript_22560/g.28809 Transcript_22560/m.28809 type:complete len:477 (+) Transcript_22560:3-1433(+)
MITPVFEIEQNADFLVVRLRAPHIKVNTFDFYIEDKTFKFYGKPYFLRLVFPCSLVEDGREKATYDIDSGIVTISLPKKNAGEHFEDLDLLTLLKKKEDPSKQKTPAISVINEMENNASGTFHLSDTDGNSTSVPLEDLENIELDWDIPQELRSSESSLLQRNTFGFNGNFCDYFDDLTEELYEILELPENPRNLTLEQRREIRVLRENTKFSIDHYMADYMEDDMIQEIMKFTIQWESLEYDNPNPKHSTASKASSNSDVLSVDASGNTTSSIFTDKEKEMLRQLPNKEYLLSKEQSRVALLNLFDILLAFTYDLRTTFGSHTVESGWTITRVSGVLSSCDSFQSLDNVIYSFLRRSLSYPLYCHWELSNQIVNDVADLFLKGKRFVLKAVLATKNMLQFCEFYAHFNKLYLDDYCVWIQSIPPSVITSLGNKAKEKVREKSAVGWDLEMLENTARELADMSEDENEDESMEVNC